MTVCTTIAELRESLKALRSDGRPVGLVPTMGALHAGHADLIRRSVAESATVVSIFVNPTQFGPNEDFDRYPRDPEADLRVCRQAGASIVFMPSVEEMYPGTQASRPPASQAAALGLATPPASVTSTTSFPSASPPSSHLAFSLRGLNEHLCGAHRPGHFEGVCLIVSKLFHAVQPDLAWFGQKDIQQYIILEHMVRELLFPVRMRMAPTVREADGLAMSSRNRYLGPEDRAKAPGLHEALKRVETAVRESMREAGRSDAVGAAWEEAIARESSRLVSNGFRIDYVGVYDRETLRPVSGVSQGEVVIAGAVHLGATRLIDNLLASVRPE